MQLQVDLKDNSYPIYIEAGCLDKLEVQISDLPEKTAIITNQKIADLYLEQVLKQLQQTDVTVILIPDSETAKSISEFERVSCMWLASR